MITITGVPERELPNVLRSISIDGLTVISIEKTADGTYNHHLWSGRSCDPIQSHGVTSPGRGGQDGEEITCSLSGRTVRRRVRAERLQLNFGPSSSAFAVPDLLRAGTAFRPKP